MFYIFFILQKKSILILKVVWITNWRKDKKVSGAFAQKKNNISNAAGSFAQNIFLMIFDKNISKFVFALKVDPDNKSIPKYSPK